MSAETQARVASLDVPMTHADVAELVAEFNERTTRQRRIAKRASGQRLTAVVAWRGVNFLISYSQDDPPVAAKRAKKDPNAEPRALSNYNAYLRTKGLFARLCKDLNVTDPEERSYRKRLAAVEGTDENSPWISVARAIWKELSDDEKEHIRHAGEDGALAELVETEAYKTYVAQHAIESADEGHDEIDNE